MEKHKKSTAPINQANYSYVIFLPNDQTYGIEGDWRGRTFYAIGIPVGRVFSFYLLSFF